MDRNIVWQNSSVNREDRERRNHHKSFAIWFTGLSGSGKSTVAYSLEKRLFEKGIQSYVLDGDNIRHGLNKDLGFSKEDRGENLRRIGEVSKLMVDAGVIVISSFISPFESDRQNVKALFQSKDFIEVFIDCPLSVCEDRDPKGLYKKARKGEIIDFTGVSSPYERPDKPNIAVNTELLTIEESTSSILDYLYKNDYLVENFNFNPQLRNQ